MKYLRKFFKFVFLVGTIFSEVSLSFLICLTKFLWLHIWILSVTVSTFSWSAISSVTPFTFDSDFTSSIITLVSLLQFHLCWQITWETRKQHSCTHCCLCVTWAADRWCPVTNRHDWSLTVMHICNLHGDCVLKSSQWSLNFMQW